MTYEDYFSKLYNTDFLGVPMTYSWPYTTSKVETPLSHQKWEVNKGTLVIELPGYKLDDIKVSFENKQVILAAKRRKPFETTDESISKYYCPPYTDAIITSVDASLRDGLLTLDVSFRRTGASQVVIRQ